MLNWKVWIRYNAIFILVCQREKKNKSSDIGISQCVCVVENIIGNTSKIYNDVVKKKPESWDIKKKSETSLRNNMILLLQ